MLTGLKKDREWLKNLNSQSLQGATLNLEKAFTKFFREKSGFSNFKSRKNPVQSFSVLQNYEMDYNNNKVKLSKIGQIITRLHRKFSGIGKTATLSRIANGKIQISILVDDEKETPAKSLFNEKVTVGIDIGIKDFAVLSNS